MNLILIDDLLKLADFKFFKNNLSVIQLKNDLCKFATFSAKIH